MTGRDDLNELHALAASISEDAHGWRAHRRQRALSAAQARIEAEAIAPVKRRKRHRWVAGAVVGVLALTAVVLVVTHKPARPASQPKRTIVTARHVPPPVRAGQAAAIQLADQGLTANIFACQSWYESQQLGDVPGQQTAAWRAGYLSACAHSTPGVDHP